MKLFTTILLSTVFLFSAQADAQEFGKASYLDMAYQGAITASGEAYDADKFTGAHKIHPFGTKLRITRQDNGRSVIVRINDRGPHIKGRIVDVSYAAAKALDMVRDGVVDVKVEVVGKVDPTPTQEPESEPETYSPPTLNIEPASERNANTRSSTASPAEVTPDRNSDTAQKSPQEKAITNNRSSDYSERLLTRPYEKYGLYEIKVLQVNKAGFGIQLASLSSYENAMRELTRLQANKINNALLSIEQNNGGGMAFKIIIGPYESRSGASQQITRLRRSLGVKGFVVDLSSLQY